MTRMWGLPTCLMCDQHLLGEHAELHQEVGQINAGNLGTVRGHAERGQIDTTRIRQRHRRLEKAMKARGMNVGSPLPAFYDPELGVGSVLSEYNMDDLAARCEDCRKRIEAFELRNRLAKPKAADGGKLDDV